MLVIQYRYSTIPRYGTDPVSRFLNYSVLKEETKVLIADNLGAHISQAVMEKCTEHNIRLA